MHKNCNLLVMRENSEDALWMPMCRWINNGSLLQEQCRAARRHWFDSTGSPNGFHHRPSLSVSCEWEGVLIGRGGGGSEGGTLIISNKATTFQGTLTNLGWLFLIILQPIKPGLNRDDMVFLKQQAYVYEEQPYICFHSMSSQSRSRLVRLKGSLVLDWCLHITSW